MDTSCAAQRPVQAEANADPWRKAAPQNGLTMKNILILILLPFALSANLQEITQALGAGDVNKLQQYFDESVEIALMDTEDVYTRSEAAELVRGFFRKNVPQSFSLVHQGTSRNNDSRYCIGDLSTSGGTYRVYIYLRVEGSRLLIQELRFDQG